MKAVRARGRMGPALEALAGIAVAGVIAFAYWRIAGGVSTVGDFMGFVTALLLAAQPIKSLGIVDDVDDGGPGRRRAHLRAARREADRGRPPGRAAARRRHGAIVFDNVGFAYASAAGTQAVKDFSLTVPGGKTVALVGRSGAGKSTVINLVARLFDVDSRPHPDRRPGPARGDARQPPAGDRHRQPGGDAVRRHASAPTSRWAGSAPATRSIVAAAKAAAAHEFIMAQPQGYDTVIGDSGLRLSGGQRQRLALARAILKDAPILLLDEATSALDTESERLVQEALTRFTRNRTTLVIAHRLSTVQRADMICVMDQGASSRSAPHADLIARDGAYARLCRSQILLDLDAPKPTSAA